MRRYFIQPTKFLTLIVAISFVFANQSLAQGTWETKAPMPTPRGAHPAVAIGGKIYVIGVHDEVPGLGFNVVSNLIVYDSAFDSWSPGTPQSAHLGGHGAAIIDGKIYVAGGCLGSPPFGPACSFVTNTLERYDPALDPLLGAPAGSNPWTTLAPMPAYPGSTNGRRAGLAAVAIDGKLYAVGGFFQCNIFCPSNNVLQRYDPALDAWTTLTDMPTCRDGMHAAAIGGKLYVAGGFQRTGGCGFGGGGFSSSKLEVYDPALDPLLGAPAGSIPWTTLTDMSAARTALGVGVIDGLLYAVGGNDGVGANLDLLEAYDRVTDVWTTQTPIPTARSQHGTAVIGNQLYVMGGASTVLLSSMEVFTPDACTAPPANIINWWPLDEISPGNVAVDLVGGADGTVIGTVNAVAGKVGGGYEFPGGPVPSHDASVDIPGGGGLNRADLAEVTIEAWINPDLASLFSDEREIVRKNYTLPSGGSGAFLLSFQIGFCASPAPCLTFFFPTASGNQQLSVPVSGIADDGGPYNFTDGFHHVAATYDGIAQKIYIDGRLIDSRLVAGPIILSTLSTDPTTTLTIGASCTPTLPSSRCEVFDGIIDELSLYDRALTQIEIQAIVSAGNAGKCTVINEPPTAEAGANQSIHAGDSVILDGSGSSDDVTPSEDLLYAWSFDSVPAGSSATLSGASTIAPSFTTDLPGDYVVSLVVTDEGGLPSVLDTVTISSLNVAPTADAGMDQGSVVGFMVTLDGFGSDDADLDPITFAWALTVRPAGSAAFLTGPDTVSPSFIPDLPGTYEAQLVVNDGFADSAPDEVAVFVITVEAAVAQMKAVDAINIIAFLAPDKITTKGNQTALGNHLAQVIEALQTGDTEKAIKKLTQAIERTDGCKLRGTPDLGKGPGPQPKKDFIADCASQAPVYTLLAEALATLTP
ncbi:MAG: hypothetical protein IIA05_08055 [Proteobacteria bacterium]|nr:hypothetical protein [Pseudomonadota bacterium]